MFDGVTVILTGATGLLGKVFSREIAMNKANLVMADINEKKGLKLVEDLRKETGNKKIVFQRCDITKPGEVRDLVNKSLDRFGRIDVLVNNAYPRNRNYGKKFEEVTYEDFCVNVDMHLGGYFLITREVSEVMKKQKSGNIINIASIYGLLAPDFRVYERTDMTMPVEYSAIKGGVINLTRYLASYLAKYNIRVNCISPGGIRDNQPKRFVEEYSKRTPLGRMGNPEDITGGLIYLLSDASSYVTGHNLIIDGGWSIW